MLLDVDLPTSMENKFKEAFPGEEGVRTEIRTTGKRLINLCPAAMHWIIANGYADFDLILTVGTKKENAQVEEPMA